STQVPSPTLTDDPADPEVDDPTEVEADVAQIPDLVLEKAAVDVNGGSRQPTHLLTYTITIQNRGAVPASNLVLFDPLPTQTAYAAGSTTVNGAPLPDGAGGLSAIMTSPGASLGALAVGQITTVVFQVRVAETALQGT